jgi:hypothetical protein
MCSVQKSLRARTLTHTHIQTVKKGDESSIKSLLSWEQPVLEVRKMLNLIKLLNEMPELENSWIMF